MHSKSQRILVIIVLLSALFSSQVAGAQSDPATSAKVTVDGRGLRVLSTRPLMTINADGSGLATLLDQKDRLHGSPQWSPDGKWLACDTWILGEGTGASRIGLLQADGSEFREIGPGAMPSWSPDGTQLVCHTYGNDSGLVTMNADGTGRETIARHWGSPRWSPTGNRIVSIAERRTGLAVFDMNTGVERTMFSGPYSIIQGISISPDGLRFCFADSRAGIALATLDEQTMQATTRWLVREGKSTHSSWSPDGKRVVVSWQAPGSKVYQLYTIEVDEVGVGATTPTTQNRAARDEPSLVTASPERPSPSLKAKGITLLPGQDATRHNVDPDWSPDGTTIVFASQAP